jgi:tripartite-type tricarboxylate transporter receptor subunit TctC
MKTKFLAVSRALRARATWVAVCALPVLVWSAAAQAQETGAYPDHPIKMVVPGAAGGASDTIGRLMADKLTTALGRAVIVENRPGAGTTMASEMLATSPPDGYTIQLMTNSHTINAAVRSSLRYDPVKDFATVILLCSQPNLMVTRKDLPVGNLKDFVALAQKERGKLTFGSAGPGSATYLAGELFKSVTGVDLLHVPYKGGTPALVDLLAGRVDVLFFPLINVSQYAKDGRLKALAITSDQRSPLVPDVPTNAQARRRGGRLVCHRGAGQDASSHYRQAESGAEPGAEETRCPEAHARDRFRDHGRDARSGLQAHVGRCRGVEKTGRTAAGAAREMNGAPPRGIGQAICPGQCRGRV